MSRLCWQPVLMACEHYEVRLMQRPEPGASMARAGVECAVCDHRRFVQVTYAGLDGAARECDRRNQNEGRGADATVRP